VVIVASVAAAAAAVSKRSIFAGRLIGGSQFNDHSARRFACGSTA